MINNSCTSYQAAGGKQQQLFCCVRFARPTRDANHTNSPQALYALAAREPQLFTKARIVKLDEWYGLKPDHPATCEYYLQEYFVGSIGIPRDRYLAFKSDAADAHRECQRVTRALAGWGGIDLAILGIGVNGHLGISDKAAMP